MPELPLPGLPPVAAHFINELPGDPSLVNAPRQVLAACYSRVSPARVREPRLAAYSASLATELGLSLNDVRSDTFTQIFSGNAVAPGMQPYAMCYGGHQFGQWAGQLGDGRAINLGEIVDAKGGMQTLQLKGAGPTPYSRRADGFAVLRSSVREFLCSEAMHGLGIPTTRALSLIVTGEAVVRDMFYDGHPKAEPGAIVCRVAPSFIRFGNFEIFTARKDPDSLKILADFTIRRYFAHLGEPSQESYAAWFAEIAERTAALMVDWQRVGFVHGVMNSDNMSILGLTLDYGPYGWVENYDEDWTPNTTDAQGRRYKYGNQPLIGQWNLVALANAIYPLLGDAQPLEDALARYEQRFAEMMQTTIAAKLGLREFTREDQALHEQLLELFAASEIDMTLFYRALAEIKLDVDVQDGNALFTTIATAFYAPQELHGETAARAIAWLQTYVARIRIDGIDDGMRRAAMNAVNPLYVLRNYLAQLAIDDAERGDYAAIRELLDVLRAPYTEQPGKERFALKRPEWARARAGCSMLSCSS